MKKVLFIFLVVVACGIAVAAIAQVTQKGNLSSEMIRVAIVRDAREAYLSIEGQYRLRDANTGKVVGQGLRLVRSRIRLLEKGILAGLDVYPVARLIIEPVRDASIIVNNHRFRGTVTLVRTGPHHITVVNGINLEDYVKGVLFHEVSNHWPMEALKAQAVATRTYALYSVNPASKDYDVTNDIYSQVYGGRESERYRTGLAVDRTAGEILVYQGKVLPTYFHATCGGMTEDAKELWPKIDLSPLRGVPCMFCQDSPHMHWKKNFRLRDIQLVLNKHGYKMGLMKDIGIVERDRSDRIKTLKITSRDGQELTISGKDFRDIVGPNALKSNNYEISMQGYYVDFVGKGWGHGVGLCQWGARGMALQQFTYKQILAYYYPGSQLMDYHDLLKSALPVKEENSAKPVTQVK
ncbi:MAG: SpoIID/LytB domain-containing protein [Candidatus Omnitrophica bacterium]|nr:SpoIID/LytB domain-containing protein [Candidatus Omnitrophota bacterium]